MMTYTLLSTMVQKLKYLPNQCFNRIVIGGQSIFSLSYFLYFPLFLDTPICGLRQISRTSPSLMHKFTEILRTIVDGVRQQHILSITMIFYKKNDINIVK